MNVWKTIVFVAIIALGLTVGAQTAVAGPCHDQPNMAEALGHLRAARASLERAEHNKGGWRVAAIEATTKAIHETERACEVADRR